MKSRTSEFDPEFRRTSPGRLAVRLSLVLRVAGVILLAGGAIIGFGRLFPEHTADHFRNFPSPDGRFDAVVFRRTGPKADVSTHVSIVRDGERAPAGPGNVLVATGEPVVIVKWRNDEILSVTGPPDSTVRFRATFANGIHIQDR